MPVIPAYTYGGITRPELHTDSTGHIILDPVASAFVAAYGTKLLYMGVPANTPYPPITDHVSPPTDTNGSANSIVEGAAAGTAVGITALSTSTAGQPVTYSLTGDNSGGGFAINATTGVVTVADATKIDYETAPGHAYSVTVRASDGVLNTSQTFTINVSDAAPTTPVDSNAGTNTVAEGAANGSTVGVTASSTDVNGPGVTYSLTGDTSGGGFTINSTTGVITVLDGTKLDYETAPGHAYTVTAQASDGTLTSSHAFTIAVSDVEPVAPVDSNGAPNTIAEGAANGTAVGITASTIDPNGPATTYSLTDSAGGRFAIDSSTGVVTVANGAAIDFESSAGHAYGITVQATNGAQTVSSAFSIGVTDVQPSAVTDTNGAANSVLEGAANGTVVGITASASDPGGGPAPTYTLTDSAGGRFAVDANTGIVTVANGAAIDFETATGHAYDVTVQATAGALSSTHTFSIGVGNVNEAPAGTDHAVLIAEDTTYTFAVSDFGFSDPSDSSAPNALLAVTITTVPGAAEGTLTNNGNPVSAGDSILAADIAAGLLVFTPASNTNGSPEATFTFQVQDNGGTANGGVDLDQSANTFTINVTAGNDAPINSVPGTQSVNEEATLTFSSGNGNAITISDVDVGSGDETVTLTVTSGVLALGSTAGLTSFTNNAASITLAGTVANVNAALNGLTYTGNLDFNGQDTLDVSTNDNGNTGTGGPQNDLDHITINVAAVNDAPVNSVPGAQTVNEDTNLVFSGANAITISDVDAGAGNETVTLSVASGALTLNGTAGLAFSVGDGTADSTMTFSGTVAAINAALNGLGYQGNLNFNGSDTLNITTNDNGNTGSGGAQSNTDNVTINITAVNDAPVNGTPGTQTVDEDTNLVFSGANAITISDVDVGAGNETVTLSVASGALTLNGTAGLAFSVGDGTADSTMTFSGTVAAINAALNGLGYQGNLNFNGSDTLNITTNDNGNTGTGGAQSDADSVTINVSAVNDAPANGVPGAQGVNEEATLTFSSGNGNAITISDVDVGAGNETVTLSVAGGALSLNGTAGLAFSIGDGVAESTMTFSGTAAAINAALDGLTYTGNLNFSGADTLNITTNDNGNTGSGGAQSDSDSVTINVAAVNDAPINSVPGAQTVNEDTNLVFSGANAITISDVDVGAGNETVTLSVASGALTLNGTAGLAFSVGDGTADSTMTFSGTVAAINAALNGLGYQGNLNFNGSDTLNITTNDNGNTGTGGAQSDADSVTINVSAVNDAPVLTAHDRDPVYAAGVQLFDSTSVSVGPADESAQNIKQLVLTVSNVDGTGSTDHLSIDGTDVFLTHGNTATGANHGVSISVALAGGTATVTISKPVGDIPAADVTSIVNGLTYTNDDVNGGESSRHVTITSIQDSGGTAPGVDTSTPNIDSTVNFNLPPVITTDGGGAAATRSVAENTTAVTTVHATDADGGPSPVSYSVLPGDDGIKFAIDSSSGVLTFVSAPDFENPTDTGDTAGNNTYVVTVRASDGVSFDDQTITVTVTNVNDAPVITSNGGGASASINVNENSTGVTTVTSTDQETPAQTLTYSLFGGLDQAKFSIDSSTGVLTFNTAPNFEVPTDNGGDNGYDVIVRVTDNGVPNLHDDQAITVHIQNVNEAPNTSPATVTGNEDAASIAITINGSDVDAGDSVASFHITGIPNAGTQGTLYSDAGLTTVVTEGADVAATGNSATLYFKPNADFNTHAGALTFNAAATDSHSLTDATPATVTINVTAVNDAPINNNVPASFIVGSGFTHAITGLSISDIDANEIGTPTDITTTLASAAGTVTIGNGASGTNAGITGGATITTNGSGSVVLTGSTAQINTTLNASNGVVYTAADNTGNTTTSITMTTNDAGHNGTGGPLTDVDIIQVGVIPQVWFIDSSPTSVDATATRGSQANPFGDVHEFNTSSGPGINDYVYVKEGTYDGEGINLKAGQTLLGDDQALSFTNPLNPGGPAIVIEDATGARPIISVNALNATDQGIALASGNTIAGINVVTNAAGQIGIDDSGASVGTLNISAADVSGGGQAINITHGGTGGSMTFGTVSSSGGATGIALGGALATTFSATSGTLSGHSGSEFSSTGGSGNVSYGGAIDDGTGVTSVSITSRSGGTVTLSGNITDGADANGGIGISGNANTTINFSGSAQVLNTGIGDGVSMTNNTGTSNVNFTGGGLDIDTTNGTAFRATVAGTYTVTGVGNSITTNGNGAALNLDTIVVGAGGITFGSTSSTNSTGTAVAIDSVTGGAIALGSGSISGSDGDAFRVGDGAGTAGTGGTSAITYSGSISKTDGSGQAVDIQDRAAGAGNITLSGNITHNLAANTGILLDDNLGGAITFSGASKAITSTTATAVNLTDNQGATIAFINGGLVINTTLGRGFNATGAGPAATTGGTVTVEDNGNTITSTTGTALNVVNTTIGADGLTFRSISSNGAANGIVLNNTGTSGGLTVTGDGGGAQNHSGGTINASTGAGVSLASTKNVSLGYLDITNGGDDGIHGEAVNGFTLNRANVNNNGDSTSDDGIQFGQDSGSFSGVTGAVTITNSSVSGNAHNNVHIRDTGTDTISSLTVTGSSFNNLNDTFGANSFLLEMSETSILTSGTFSNNTVQNNSPQRGLEVQTHDTARIGTSSGTGGLTVSGNTFVDNGIQASFTQDGASNLTFKFLNNGVATPMTGSILQAVNVFSSSQSTGGTIFGTISGNHIGNAAVLNSGSTQGGGISATIQGQTDATLLIDGNTIVQTNGDSRGIYVGFRGPANPLAGTLPGNTVVSDLTLTNNTVTPNNTANNFGAAIVVEADNQSLSDAKAPTVRANITGNTVPTIAAHPVNGEFFAANLIYFEYSTAGAHGIGQLVDTAPANANATDQLTSTNTGTSQASTGIVLIPGPIGTPPLNAAAGGVQASSPTPGETHLTQAQLDSVVAAAISQWQAAGASAAQIAALHAVTFGVADLSGTVIGEQSPGHITIDADAAGHGWFVDPTPNDSLEFTQAANAAGTDRYTVPSTAAAGHLDLLTAVAHEMGHVLGLEDLSAASDSHDLMFSNLVDGERRLPDAGDVPVVNTARLTSHIALGPVDTGTPGDQFVFTEIPAASAPLTHVANYSFAEGDSFDFSALTSQFHYSGVQDSSLVRVVEDSSGAFATLQFNLTPDAHGVIGALAPEAGGARWTSIAQLDSIHAGDDVSVLIDSHAAVHVAHLHAGLLT